MRKVVITTVGMLLLISGALMLLTPLPGIVVLALGLGVLSMEYHWSRKWLRYAQRKMRSSAVWMDRRVSSRKWDR